MPERPSVDSPPAKRPTLGKRWAGWACNILATGLILMAGLVFGRRIIQWWGQEPGVANRPVVTDQRLGDPQQTHWIQFGQLPGVMSRTAFSGDSATALARLADLCRQAALEAPTPLKPAGPAEARMLATIDRQSPVASEPGKWQVFTLDGPLPMAVSLRFVGANDPSAEVVGPTRRVVSWAIGMPIAPQRWVLFSYQPSASSAGSDLQLPPPPEGAVRTVQSAVTGGGVLLGVAGEGSLETWADWYDQWFAERHWQSAGWHIGDATRQNRYEYQNTGRIDIHLSTDASGVVRGILSYTPNSTTQPADENARGETNQ